MKRLLILFANGFPYHISEPFLEHEYPLYKEYFDKVLIVTACRRGEQPTRQIDDPSIEILRDYTLSKDPLSVAEAIPGVITDSMFYQEIKSLLRGDGFSAKKLYDLLAVSLCGNHRVLLARRWLKKHPEYEVSTLYGYWLHIPAYAAVRLKQQLKNHCYAISRAHGFDLYLERHPDGYLPFHRQIYSRLDEVASVSEHGKAYLRARYGSGTKVSVSRLGALDRSAHNPSCTRSPLRIVTCSRTIPLKRLDRVVDALCLMTDREIYWTHLGGGESQEALERYAAAKLPKNVSAAFTNTVPNARVYQIYGEQPFHVFLNVSETEGVPVSMMEAMSFDIPVIAAAVGGTPELVDDGENGFLIPVDFTDRELARCIQRIADMGEAEYQSFREKARRKFEGGYDAISNYRKFLEHLREAGT